MNLKDHKGRGSQYNLPNRFEKIHSDEDFFDDEYFENTEDDRKIVTEYFNDDSKSVLTENKSPDIKAKFSINPYRGCEHGCIYCYARPTHEYLGFSSGLDFESKIMVKQNAPDLLRKEFLKKSWIPQPVFFSGNTDCYQPVERKLQITRKCLEVFSEFRNPVMIITKNSLIKRDADILTEMAELNIVKVIVSITTLNFDLQRKMEPRTSSPAKRLDTIEYLSSKGIPAGVNIAPIIPGLTDEEIPEILKQSSERGAAFAGRVILRLPHSVKILFENWLEKNYPERSVKILNRVREMHGGGLYNHTFGRRLTGEGKYADLIKMIFDSGCRKYGLNENVLKLSADKFTLPAYGQGSLF
ncbi:MAG TPA: PA0069 family radical SAM protein [Ignavibacteria bacterium]|nr:radical SAM protein [Bacteroidota bacterium]HRI84839.1 PA0069 family radical SAM protein [Ignavibacteria bacterium]HRK00208.1 PA0069 family radical SAM protein [Ignavibacteria bacterium]